MPAAIWAMARMWSGTGAAAAADDVEPAVIDEALELGGERLRGFVIEAGFRIGKASVGIAGEAGGCEFMKRADVIGHELGTGGAVEADREEFGVGDGGVEGVGCLAAEHGAGSFDSAGDHDGDDVTEFFAKAVDGEQAGFDVASVLAGFEKKDVRTAREQRFGLVVVISDELRESDAAGDGDGFGGGAHGAGDEARAGGGRKFVGGLAGELGGGEVQLVRFVFEGIFGEDDFGAAEAVGFDDIGTGLEIGAVNVENDIRAGEDEIFVAAFEGGGRRSRRR